MANLQRTGYESARPTHLCAASGRRFEPGEPFVATLTEPPLTTTEEDGAAASSGEELVRVDYALDAWEAGARPDRPTVAVWRAVERDASRQPSLIPDADELWSMFESLDQEAEGRAAVFRYLLALMLMRKRVLRLVDQRVGKTGRPVLILAKRGAPRGAVPETSEVVDPGMDEDAIAAGIDELSAVLADGEPAGGTA